MIEISRDNGVAVLTMARGKANALNGDMVARLADAVWGVQNDDAVRAVVLASGRPNFFCSGFDIREVFAFERDAMRAFWLRFTTLYRALRDLPKPLVGALRGHTFAGGLVLALTCDVRVMAHGDYGLAVSGINLGIPLPEPIMHLAILACGEAHARHLFLTGEQISPERAHEIGMVRELVDTEDDVLPCAVKWAGTLAGKSPSAYAAVKTMFDNVSLRPADGDPEVEVDRFLEFWFSDDAKACRDAILARVGSR